MPKLVAPIEEEDSAFSKAIDIYSQLPNKIEEENRVFLDPLSRVPSDFPVSGVEYDEESGMPIMPEDLTALTSQDLGRLFQAVEAWDAYFRSLATKADQEKVVAKEVLDLVKAKIKEELRVSGEKISKDDLNDRILIDPRYLKANTEYLRAKFVSERISDMKSTVSRRFSLISREITRRQGDRYGKDVDLPRRFS